MVKVWSVKSSVVWRLVSAFVLASFAGTSTGDCVIANKNRMVRSQLYLVLSAELFVEWCAACSSKKLRQEPLWVSYLICNLGPCMACIQTLLCTLRSTLNCRATNWCCVTPSGAQ